MPEQSITYLHENRFGLVWLNRQNTGNTVVQQTVIRETRKAYWK
jgi:hypothetical protein